MVIFSGDQSNNDVDKNKYDNINVPVTAQPRTLALSPYLNYDPSYLPSNQPEFIFPEGVSRQRGRFEVAFSEIGAVCMTGTLIGGISGFARGIKAAGIAGHKGKVRNTLIINHVIKSGSSWGNTLGVLSVLYSGIGVGLSLARGTDDSINTVVAAAATGMLYKSTSGLRTMLTGGGVGLALASMYCLWNIRHKMQDFRHSASLPA